jgi:molybdopterin/thiamine biosynthesis adenylyltransferase
MTLGKGVIPKLKDATWERLGGELMIMLEPHEVITLDDPEGQVGELLRLLSEGTQSLDVLTRRLQESFPDVTAAEVADCIDGLDSLRMLERATTPAQLAQRQQERYFSNSVFFSHFATLSREREEFQRRLLDAHVVILGVGGLGSTVLMQLTGAGVGRFTLLDHDVVELRNFSRQFIFRRSDLGRSKVARAAEWVTEFDPATGVLAVDQRITCAGDIAALLPGTDVLIGAIDTPPLEIAYWINTACVAAGVPHVRGGMSLQPQYYSVDPGASACVECDRLVMLDEQAGPTSSGVRWRLMQRQVDNAPNPGVGPVAGLIGSAIAMEAIRYITGFTEPVAAGALHTFDLINGSAEEIRPWPARPDCPVCPTAGRSAARRPSGEAG